MITSATAPAPILTVRKVAKSFGGIRAVIDGNLTVARGEMLGLVGPNGCGKSTMLNVVSGLLAPDHGTVTFDGEPLPLGRYRAVQDRGIVLVPQELALAPNDTVWESIVLGSEPRRLGRINRSKAREMAHEALRLLDHELPLNALVGELTPVQTRIVMIARGIARPNTKLLILDEPTAGLPHDEAQRVLATMRRVVDSNHALILVSHHIEDLVSVCRRVTLMRDGRTTTTLSGEEVTKERIIELLLAGVAQNDISAAVDHDRPTPGEGVGSLSEVHGRELSGVDLSVRRGEVVGVAGVLGSGVTEVIEVLTGDAHPRSGAVAVSAAGRSPSSPHRALKAGVGYVSGNRSSLVIRTMSVSEHVALPALRRLAARGVVSRRREREYVTDSLQALAVIGAPEALMTSLSGGNQQRALMARWVKAEIDLLVVDQPTVGVDLAGRLQVLNLLRDFARRGCGVVVVAEPDELAAVCDRVVCLRRGVVVGELSGESLTEDHILSRIA